MTLVTIAVPSTVILLGQVSTISDICECDFFQPGSAIIVFAAVLKFTYEEKVYMGVKVTNMAGGCTRHLFLKYRSYYSFLSQKYYLILNYILK